jgi:putative acetyltransferase
MNYSLFKPEQAGEIQQMFTNTFSDSEGESEGALIGNLVKELIETTPSQDLYVFAALDRDKIVGGILFTRLTFDTDIVVFLLAPVAVATDYQGKGIGQGLISFGLQTLKTEGVRLVFTYGNPNFYSKVGFQQVSEQQFKAPLALSYPDGWMAQSLTDEALKPIAGESSCVAGFNKPELW